MGSTLQVVRHISFWCISVSYYPKTQIELCEISKEVLSYKNLCMTKYRSDLDLHFYMKHVYMW
jgi:hypothetical protein